jgi:hypothetical protein
VTKWWNASDQHCRSDSAGGGSRLIMKMTRMGCTDHRGGCISAISTALRPRSEARETPRESEEETEWVWRMLRRQKRETRASVRT